MFPWLFRTVVGKDFTWLLLIFPNNYWKGWHGRNFLHMRSVVVTWKTFASTTKNDEREIDLIFWTTSGPGGGLRSACEGSHTAAQHNINTRLPGLFPRPRPFHALIHEQPTRVNPNRGIRTMYGIRMELPESGFWGMTGGTGGCPLSPQLTG